ncbi:hypothetical protein DICSQDRAFT_71664 [Dichomitus squalens LYAD-421 SS1]|uniref:Uncharacterized protein n=1 Tax=Dichomitus squalens (strain LYAD-421) TaxID=732165 RepID=R7SJN9_DICSQ|nr:uncharacterized protein DICSQDRAFT_71664 [Dichomitus squalens LYAD-421 SS1]EJF56359.1 hypothetical protein DICSQDRAFT_71664 [Dichomitus squalens LYAD-421 SS1]
MATSPTDNHWQTVQNELRIAITHSEDLGLQVDSLCKENLALRRRIERFPSQQARAIDKAVSAATAAVIADSPSRILQLKERGVVSESVRMLVRDLMSLGIHTKQIKEAIIRIAATAGITVEGDISERTELRIMGEGKLLSECQIVDEIKKADSLTLSSNGTHHRHIPHESRHIQLNTLNGESTTHTLGITTAPNHTSNVQAEGWKSIIQSFHDTYNASPLGQEEEADARLFWTKVCGMMTDHAEDQKKLAKVIHEWKLAMSRELRTERAVAQAPLPELLLALAEETNAAVARAGGADAWSQLSSEEIKTENLMIQQSVANRLGEEAYNALPDTERLVANMFIHGGCCMHKELNAFKGGNTRMMAYWATSSFAGPILLMNRDNDAAAAAGASTARKRALDISRGGGVKLAELGGSAFRHKNDKKGQQDSARYFFEVSLLGKLLTFPDTSNTRSGSYGDAASVLVAYLHLFRRLLELIRDKKDSGQLNHLEENVYRGLHDYPTLAELCVLSLYSQAISHPYMRTVRSPERPNYLTLVDFHHHLIQHVQKLIDDPDLLLSPSALPESATLDGQPWDSPDAIAGIRNLQANLPYLRPLLVEFLQGALVTWKRFTIEFAPGGVIERLTETQQNLAAMPKNNDRNEGGLGFYRGEKRKAPNMPIDQHNARVMWRQNNTSTYAQTAPQALLGFVRGLAREREGEGRERKRRRELAEAEESEAAKKRVHRDVVQAKKTARFERLKGVRPILRLQDLKKAKVTVATLNEQLDWHREWVDTAHRNQREIPTKTKLSNKRRMLRALRSAVRRYNTDSMLRQGAQELLLIAGVVWDEAMYTYNFDEPEEEGAEEDAESDGEDERETGDACGGGDGGAMDMIDGGRRE